MPQRSDVKTRPFHETVVDEITQSTSVDYVLRLMCLIEKTTIPKGHVEIMAAVEQFFGYKGDIRWTKRIRRVRESLFAQKQTMDRNKLDNAGTDMLPENVRMHKY